MQTHESDAGSQVEGPDPDHHSVWSIVFPLRHQQSWQAVHWQAVHWQAVHWQAVKQQSLNTQNLRFDLQLTVRPAKRTRPAKQILVFVLPPLSDRKERSILGTLTLGFIALVLPPVVGRSGKPCLRDPGRRPSCVSRRNRLSVWALRSASPALLSLRSASPALLSLRSASRWRVRCFDRRTGSEMHDYACSRVTFRIPAIRRENGSIDHLQAP